MNVLFPYLFIYFDNGALEYIQITSIVEFYLGGEVGGC